MYSHLSNLFTVLSWKLSRGRTLSQAANDAINAVVNNINVLNDRYYDQIEQTQDACFYYPEANGQPLIFRGQCNDDIKVTTNFNATRVRYDYE
jgi:retinol-binding protein 4